MSEAKACETHHLIDDVSEKNRRFQAACATLNGIYAAWNMTIDEGFKLTSETPEAMRVIADIAVKQADALLEALK